jgi:N-acetylglucosaminyl-diphospho-decaprenol L-rhamnosyltransferase
MDDTGPTTLLIVVVNYRTADLTIDCLRSLESQVDSLPGVRLVVVDNASGDGSPGRLVDAVRQGDWGRWASVQALGENGGFAHGNNAAIRPALRSDEPPRYVLLLNPDTIVRPGALSALVGFMDARPEVGIAGSRLEDPDGTQQRSAFRFPSILGELEDGMRLGIISKLLSRWVVAPPSPQEPCRVDWVAGASMIIRREVFDAIGLLDEAYFMYFEEVDLCLRAHRAGWPCWYVPESRVVHLVGRSSGVTDPRAARKRRPGYWFLSRRRYFRSNLGAVKTLVADLGWIGGFASWRLRIKLQGKPDTAPQSLLRDFIRYSLLAADT